MKIGILTYHHTTNYGATLQTLALFQFLKSAGHEVYVIDYRPLSAKLAYFKANYVSKQLINNIGKVMRFEKFLKENVNLLPLKTQDLKGLEEASTQLDALVCGSDEIWNIDSFRGFDKSYFLDFGRKDLLRISYAASVGHAQISSENINVIGNLLENFQTILVRDSKTQKIVNSRQSIKSSVVLDPTFLYDFESDIKKEDVAENYLLIYGVLDRNELIKIREFANKQGLKVYSVGYKNNTVDKNFISVDPQEWLKLYRNSSAIVTNFYHGLLFSLILKKPYRFILKNDKKDKVVDFVERHRLDLDTLNSIDSGEKSINQQVKNSIFNEIENSKKLLLNALKTAEL